MKNMTLKNLEKTKQLLIKSGLVEDGDDVDNMAINAFYIMRWFNYNSVENVITEFVEKKELKALCNH